jgi:hypothetical protein
MLVERKMLALPGLYEGVVSYTVRLLTKGRRKKEFNMNLVYQSCRESVDRWGDLAVAIGIEGLANMAKATYHQHEADRYLHEAEEALKGHDQLSKS